MTIIIYNKKNLIIISFLSFLSLLKFNYLNNKTKKTLKKNFGNNKRYKCWFFYYIFSFINKKSKILFILNIYLFF